MSLVNPSSPGAFSELNFFKLAIISSFVKAVCVHVCACMCVCVCVFVCIHTHTEDMCYATCQNLCGFLVTMDDSMFIQLQ